MLLGKEIDSGCGVVRSLLLHSSQRPQPSAAFLLGSITGPAQVALQVGREGHLIVPGSTASVSSLVWFYYVACPCSLHKVSPL